MPQITLRQIENTFHLKNIVNYYLGRDILETDREINRKTSA